MVSRRRRGWRWPWWSPLVLLLPASVYVLGQPREAAATSRLQAFPRVILGMPSVDVPASEMVLESLKPSDILLRSYRRPGGQPLWLVIVFFQNARWGAHDPRVCYVSQGFEVEEGGARDLRLPSGETLAAQLFWARRQRESRTVLAWWYVPGAGAAEDAATYRRLLMLEGLKRNATHGAFVRLSTPASPDGEELQILDRFAVEVARALPLVIVEG